MGQFIHASSANIYTPGGNVKYSENTTFPATNVNLYTRPYRPWKSLEAVIFGGVATDNTRSYVGVDLGVTPVPVVAIIVDNVNLTSCYIQSSTDAATWADATAGGPQTISEDGADGKRKLYIATTGTKRYWRIVANSDTTPTAGQAMQVGSFICLSAVTTWTVNSAFPYQAQSVWPSIPNTDGIAGGGFPIVTGNRYAEVTLTSSHYLTSMEATLQALAAFGQHVPLIFYRNYSSTAEVYICHATSVRYSLAGPNHLRMDEVVLREVA